MVLHQLRTGLSSLAREAMADVIIAYEPVWAIGTGRTATPDDAAAVHRVIRAALVELIDAAGQAVPILYGGSGTPATAAALPAAWLMSQLSATQHATGDPTRVVGKEGQPCA